MYLVTVEIKTTVVLDISAGSTEDAREEVYNMTHEELAERIEDAGLSVEIDREVTEVSHGL